MLEQLGRRESEQVEPGTKFTQLRAGAFTKDAVNICIFALRTDEFFDINYCLRRKVDSAKSAALTNAPDAQLRLIRRNNSGGKPHALILAGANSVKTRGHKRRKTTVGRNKAISHVRSNYCRFAAVAVLIIRRDLGTKAEQSGKLAAKQVVVWWHRAASRNLEQICRKPGGFHSGADDAQ